MLNMKTTLKEAIANGTLEQFIAEHANELGDSDQLEETIARMVQGKLKEDRATSD